MSRIEYRIGDMFNQLPKDRLVVIPHIVNNLGAFGAGFVVHLAKNYPKSKESYLNWASGKQEIPKFDLGNTQPVKVDDRIIVCNMLAQKGVISPTNPKPIRYFALAKCLEKVNNICGVAGTEIHGPAFGSDLSGGDWRVISALIDEILILPTKIYIYTLTQEQQDRLLK